MKITVNIDCTAQEARSFLGLPDLGPIQEAFMAGVQEKISAGLEPQEMEKLFELWMSPGVKMAGQMMDKKTLDNNMAAFQEMFWNATKSSQK